MRPDMELEMARVTEFQVVACRAHHDVVVDETVAVVRRVGDAATMSIGSDQMKTCRVDVGVDGHADGALVQHNPA